MQPIPAPLTDWPDLQSRISATIDAADERSFFHDTVAEYTWARDVAGLAPSTLHRLVQPVLELCAFYDCVPWWITPRQLDHYFAGAGSSREHLRAVAASAARLDVTAEVHLKADLGSMSPAHYWLCGSRG